tara:strand:- start:1612 stop:2172 length:561 start_codon:yes stop_codon:yes gene_type:complete
MSTNFLEKVKSDLQDTAKDVTQILKETSNKVGEATLKAADKIGDAAIETSKNAVDKSSESIKKSIDASTNSLKNRPYTSSSADSAAYANDVYGTLPMGGAGDTQKASDYDIDEEGNLIAPATEITVIAKLPDGNTIKLTTDKGLWPKKAGKKSRKVLKAKKGGKKLNKILKKTRKTKKTVKKSKKN